MTLLEAVPELVGDVTGGLIRLGRGDVADQLPEATLAAWTFDDFAQATYLYVAPKRDRGAVEETVSLYDDIPVNVDLDGNGRIVGLDVVGYEEVLSRLMRDRSAAMTAYELTIELRPTYLHAKVTGERTPENALRFLQEVSAACTKNSRSSVLLEMRLVGPSLNTTDIFRVISERSPHGSTLRRIAYVEAAVSDPAKARFAETVAINRAVNVRLFTDVAEAARWLEAKE